MFNYRLNTRNSTRPVGMEDCNEDFVWSGGPHSRLNRPTVDPEKHGVRRSSNRTIYRDGGVVFPEGEVKLNKVQSVFSFFCWGEEGNLWNRLVLEVWCRCTSSPRFHEVWHSGYVVTSMLLQTPLHCDVVLSLRYLNMMCITLGGRCCPWPKVICFSFTWCCKRKLTGVSWVKQHSFLWWSQSRIVKLLLNKCMKCFLLLHQKKHTLIWVDFNCHHDTSVKLHVWQKRLTVPARDYSWQRLINEYRSWHPNPAIHIIWKGVVSSTIRCFYQHDTAHLNLILTLFYFMMILLRLVLLHVKWPLLSQKYISVEDTCLSLM